MRLNIKQQVLYHVLIGCVLLIERFEATKYGRSGGKGYQALEIIGKTPVDLVEMRGFKSELHYAPTKAGYLIHLVRIINPRVHPGAQLKRPVIFNHGLIESSTIWLGNSRGVKPLPYTGQCGSVPQDPYELNGTFYRNAPMMLANYGYDVWLMSMRGTDFSLEHETLNPLDAEFWDFCWDDFALDDTPSVIEYVRKVTGAPKVGYVGHSQATWSMFGLLATEPDYADIVEPFVAVAPVTSVNEVTSGTRPIFLAAEALTTDLVNAPFPSSARQFRNNIAELCMAKSEKRDLPLVCKLLAVFMMGRGAQWRKGFYSLMPYYTSVKVLRHIGQMMKSKKYARYDYGRAKNLEVYGTPKSPIYDLAKIRSRTICMIHSKTDSLATPLGAERIKSELQVPLYGQIYLDRISDHLGMIFDEKANELVNKPILEWFESIESNSGLCSENGGDHDSHGSQ